MTPWFLFVVSIASYCCVHYLLRAYLVRTIFRHVQDERSGGDRSAPKEEDVADITTKVISAIFALGTSTIAMKIMWDTANDVIRHRSSIILPFTYIGIAYMLCDLVSMYWTYCISRHRRMYSTNSVLRFLKSKPFIVIHHLVLVIFGFPLGVYPSLRKGLGDFLIGTLFIRELSSPLLAIAKILKRLNLQSTLAYQLNGLFLLLTFFLVRIASTPLTLLLFAAQYHSWSLTQALSSMTLYCHVPLLLEFVLQLNWFRMLLNAAVRHKTL